MPKTKKQERLAKVNPDGSQVIVEEREIYKYDTMGKPIRTGRKDYQVYVTIGNSEANLTPDGVDKRLAKSIFGRINSAADFEAYEIEQALKQQPEEPRPDLDYKE